MQEGIECCSVYGSMDQTARKISVGRFRSGRVQFMLVTDVAARGIDIPLIDNVINYDFTPKPKLFVHRAGRAARAGRSGTAVSFVTTDEYPYLIDLHLFLSRPLRVVPLSGQEGTKEMSSATSGSWCGLPFGALFHRLVHFGTSWCTPLTLYPDTTPGPGAHRFVVLVEGCNSRSSSCLCTVVLV
jgi:hypothetical protein